MKVYQANKLLCEYRKDPIAIEVIDPLLSWQMPVVSEGTRQSAYRVVAATSIQKLKQPDLWDTGKVKSDQCQVIYGGSMLSVGVPCYWRVLCYDEQDNQLMWSEPARFMFGVQPGEWQGEWIGYDKGRDAYNPSVPYYCADDFEKGQNKPFLPPPVLLRTEFPIKECEKITGATLYASAMGLCEVYINGKKATAGQMVPGISDYRKRVYYHAYDVTTFIKAGSNAFCAVLADGWYAGYIGLNPREWWGKLPRFNAMLLIRFANGCSRVVSTNPNWRAAFGPYLYADILHGEGYDARNEQEGWNKPGFDDSGWQAVDMGAEFALIPTLHPGVPIVEHARLLPVTMTRLNPNSFIIDFGQCFSGVVSLELCGERGASVDIYHAEELEAGDLYLRGNRSAQVHDEYVLKGSGTEHFMPQFTYHGFRYAKICIQGDALIQKVEGVAISSQLPDKTEFCSSNTTTNAIFSMIRWTQQSNQFDMPTDVCARDERLGWGAEGHFFMNTATYLNNNVLFLRKWMRDIADSQLESGAFWANAPAVVMDDITPFAGDLQSDMGIHVCYLLYLMYRDIRTVEIYFPALERYFAFLERNSDRNLRFAIAKDWLDIEDNGHSDYLHGFGRCPSGILGTAYFACSAQMMAQLASGLGREARAVYYRKKYREIRAMFRTFFVQRDHTLRDATQGAYLVALAFDLLEPFEVEAAKEELQKSFLQNNGLCCGTASAPVALMALQKVGLEKLALDCFTSTSYPSLGYMLKNGATAVWERWDGKRNDVYHPHAMNAFNHIGLATLGASLISMVTGIIPIDPGFQKVRISPLPSAEISAVKAMFESLQGEIAVDWKLDDKVFYFSCRVPANTQAEIILPYCNKHAFLTFKGEKGVNSVRQEQDKVIILAGPGSYAFEGIIQG